MKIPSRLMPQYQAKKAGVLPILVLGLILIAALIISNEFRYVFIALLFLILSFYIYDKPKYEQHFNKLVKARRSLSICDFAREFDPKEIDTWVIRATYEEVQKILGLKISFPIKGSDNLKEDLLLDDDDLDIDLVEMIAQRTGRTLNNYENNPYYGEVTTVKKLVLFMNSQAKANAI